MSFNIVKIPKRTIKIPPKTCHLKVIHVKIISKIHGREFGIFLNTPLFPEPDIRAKTKKLIAITNNRVLQKYTKYNFTFCFDIVYFIILIYLNLTTRDTVNTMSPK